MKKLLSLIAQLSSLSALLFSCTLNADSYETAIPASWEKSVQHASSYSKATSPYGEARRNSIAFGNALRGNETTEESYHVDPESIPADLAYWIADIKVKEDGVKIIEFGDGNFAGYKVLDNMYHPGSMWQAVWENLFKLDVPIWYVGEYASSPDVVAWEYFKKNGGYYSPSLDLLQRNTHFLRHAKKRTALLPTRITDYQGIIVLKRYNPAQRTVERFSSQYPDFLILNDSSTMHVSDKHLTDKLFNSPELRAYRPQALVLPKEYTKTLAQEITDKIPGCKWFVIKPINSGRGNGIIMVNKANLDDELRKVLIQYKNTQTPNNDISVKLDPPLMYDYWKLDRNTHFLVEEFCESKPLRFNKKDYDATMRVVFMMRYEEGKIKTDILNAYWKRPVKALSESGTFKEKHISKHAPNAEESAGGAVSKEDRKLVEESMVKMLPHVYWNILASYYTSAN